MGRDIFTETGPGSARANPLATLPIILLKEGSFRVLKFFHKVRKQGEEKAQIGVVRRSSKNTYRAIKIETFNDIKKFFFY